MNFRNEAVPVQKDRSASKQQNRSRVDYTSSEVTRKTSCKLTKFIKNNAQKSESRLPTYRVWRINNEKTQKAHQSRLLPVPRIGYCAGGRPRPAALPRTNFVTNFCIITSRSINIFKLLELYVCVWAQERRILSLNFLSVVFCHMYPFIELYTPIFINLFIYFFFYNFIIVTFDLREHFFLFFMKVGRFRGWR